MKEDAKDLRDLILAHLDERLNDGDFGILQKRLEGDEEARRAYVELARLDASLREDGQGELPVAEVVTFPSSDARPRQRNRMLAAAAVIGLSVIATWAAFHGSAERASREELAQKEVGAPITRGVAVIAAEAGAAWDSDLEERRLGEGVTVPPGRLVLSKGLVQIDFFGGASISLSGPAEIELIGPDEAVLHRGRLRADVPPAARGFEIRAGEVMIEDLGTSFGLSVGEDENGDVVVFDGEIRAIGTDGKPISLFGGDSAQLRQGEAVPQPLAMAGEFPDIEEVFAGSGSRNDRQYQAWKEASEDLRRDPRLIAYYDFENLAPTSRRLRNRAMVEDASELDGGIVGARVAEGRWMGKTALDFRSEGDRVRFDIPGEWDAITLFAWVRIDALDRHLNSLFLTDYFDENEIHWQLSDTGHMHFACSPMGAVDIPEHNRRFFSEDFWNPSMSGQWMLLAVTAEKGIGKVAHYVNGRPLPISDGTQRHKPLETMRIGEADLGNWSDPIWDHSIRTLNGRIDEFAIFGAALSPEEIAKIYEVGRP